MRGALNLSSLLKNPQNKKNRHPRAGGDPILSKGYMSAFSENALGLGGWCAFLALAFLPEQAVAATAKYYIPPSQFNAATQSAGSEAVAFRSATGSFTFDKDGNVLGHVRLALEARRTALGSASYPEVTFTATDSKLADGKGEIKGTLTMQGISRAENLEAEIAPANDEAGSLQLSLHGSFKPTDFGLQGGDSVTLLLDARAIRQ